MKVTIFGATGGTGKLVVEQALAKGHRVTAFTRSPHKISTKAETLTIIEGDILETDKVSDAIQGAEAIISALGPADNKAEFVISRGMQHILAAMEAHSVSRLIVSTGAGVGDPNDNPKLINRIINFMLKTVSKNVYEDMAETIRLVRASSTNWTIVRAPMLTDDPSSGTIQVGWVGGGSDGAPDIGMRLSREDFAAFMVDQLTDDSYLNQAPAISSGQI